MKNIEINLLLLSLVLTAFSFKEINAQSLNGVWNGTMRMEQKYEGEMGIGEKKVNITITDNRARGTVQTNGELIIGGKLLCTGSCSGAGVAELHEVIIDYVDSTYRIHAVSPSYTCTHAGSYCDTSTTDGHGHELDVIASDIRLNNNPNVLTGSKTEVTDASGAGTVTTTVTWNLVRSIDVELIVTPENYNNWLPEPGQNELTKGTVIKINLKVYGRNGQPPTLKAKSFELRLSNTSNEPGITINAPLVPLFTLPDLRFLPQANAAIGEQFQLVKVECNDGINGNISIGAFDGGAYSTLTAVAILEDNTRIEGHLLISGGNTEIPIPKRPANSKIATAWLNAHNNPTDTYDDESSAGNSNNGDGLTAYEEYRGVISKGRFKRLDPQEKELGVVMKPGEVALFTDGIGWFENATGLKIIRFDAGEIGANRMLNKNHLTAHSYDQYALRLLKGHVRRNILGRAEGGPEIPKNVKRVIIDYNQIVQMQSDLEREARLQNITLPFNLQEMVAKTVAHELGHGINIHHHGNHELTELDQWIENGDPVRIFLPRASAEVTDRRYRIVGTIGRTGGQQSGDIFCIMCYNPCFDYSLKENNNFYTFYIVPLLPLGNLMCNDAAGTDINATSYYFGDATIGNCLSRIKLK